MYFDRSFPFIFYIIVLIKHHLQTSCTKQNFFIINTYVFCFFFSPYNLRFSSNKTFTNFQYEIKYFSSLITSVFFCFFFLIFYDSVQIKHHLSLITDVFCSFFSFNILHFSTNKTSFTNFIYSC